MKLTYEIPQGFSDEIKWLKFFHTRSIKMLAITVTPGIVIARFLHSFRVLLVFIAFWALLVIILTGSTMIKMPASRWLNGGGQYFDQLALKKFIRSKERCLYVKGYNQTDYEEREREFEKKLGEMKGVSNHGILIR